MKDEYTSRIGNTKILTEKIKYKEMEGERYVCGMKDLKLLRS